MIVARLLWERFEARTCGALATTAPPAEGVVLRHARTCALKRTGDCSCSPSFQAQVWSSRDSKPIRKTFKTLKEARRWRQEAQVKLRLLALNAPSSITLAAAASEWLEAARAGVIRTRSGALYKPSAIRAYDFALRKYLLPRPGGQGTNEVVIAGRHRIDAAFTRACLAAGGDPGLNVADGV